MTELGTLNGDLQNQLTSLRHELAVANAELRIHSTRSENQALREQTQASATAPATATQEPMTGSSPADVFAKPGFSRSDNYHAPQPAKSSPEVSVQLQQQQQQQYRNSTREPVYSTSAFLHSSRDDELELSFPARQRIQATEAYAKDLHRQ